MQINKKYILITVLLLLFLVAGIGAGYFLGVRYEDSILTGKLDIIQPIREHNTSYKFIDPLLAYIIPSSDQKTGLGLLKNKIKGFIDNQSKSGALTGASVFFYDLNRGRWIGINETEKYNPASLLKVVIMVSYFKEAEKNPDIFKKYFTYTNAIASIVKNDLFNTPSNLEIGKSYGAEDLIKKMIIDSDNGAQFLLLDNINQTSLDYVYNILNIENPSMTKSDFVISPRTYSLFFRILYSATYLNDIDSEKALSILSKTIFNDGLVAGVPNNTVIAHKFGEYVLQQNNTIKEIELHDCGIIYYPNYPYFLCIMTKGANLDNLKNTIKNISSLVYENYKEL